MAEKIIKVIIEIPKDSNIKYEFDRETRKMKVDRILRDGFIYPSNYGFIEEALDWDGDELDVLVYSSEKFVPGVEVNARIVGAMKMIDDGETDTKLIAVHHDDYRLNNIQKLEDLPKNWLEKVETFFSTYKNWKREGITKVPGFESIEWAWKEYEECYKLMKDYGHLPKEEFIEKMKKKHPGFLISCSNNQTVNAKTKDQINKQYEYFANALIKENIKNNLYFENFIFDENNQAILNLDEINTLLSMQNLSNSYEYKFILNKDINTNSIKINMQLRIKNSNTDFIDYGKVEKIIYSVKSLTLDEQNALNNIYDNWYKNSNKVIIKNNITNEILEQSKISTILPSYLQMNDITFDYSTTGLNQTISKENVETNKIFNDYLGQIVWDLSIINSKTKLIFYPKNILHKQMIINGFANLNDRNAEIIDIFDKLSRTFSIVTLIGSDKKIPYLASGVTTVEQFKSMFELINKNLKNETNQYIDNILQILNDAINQTKWFNLEMTSNANDITGNLVITWKLVDRFTSYEIFPSNINKITTINDMLTLSKKIIENNQEVEDLSAIDNGYKAYQLLTSLEINNKYVNLPSNNIISSINIDWLLSNTNIKTLFPDIVKSQDNKYLEFSMTTNSKTNKFRFSLDLTKITDIKPNLIIGTIQLPFIMQIQLEDLFVSSTPDINNPLVNSIQYIDFLPPSGKSDSSNNSSYNSAQRDAFINIGGYLTKDLEIASFIYD